MAGACGSPTELWEFHAALHLSRGTYGLRLGPTCLPAELVNRTTLKWIAGARSQATTRAPAQSEGLQQRRTTASREQKQIESESAKVPQKREI